MAINLSSQRHLQIAAINSSWIQASDGITASAIFGSSLSLDHEYCPVVLVQLAEGCVYGNAIGALARVGRMK